MRRVLLSALAVALVYATPAVAETPKCLKPSEAARVNVTGADGGIMGNVLCCCRTFSGQCCNYVSMCGFIVPGCMCSGNRLEMPRSVPTGGNAG